MNKRNEIEQFFSTLQQSICSDLEQCDGKGKFIADSWQRPDKAGEHGGGGTSCVLRKGAVFEQAGVNFSSVHGTMPAEMSEKLVGDKKDLPFFATGVSLVLHPHSPMVPTTHANVRYLEVGGKSWFGGGTDLTPYYLFEEDAEFFHSEIKKTYEQVAPELFQPHKEWCDQYFYLPHRQEARGIGGVFYDYVGRDTVTELALGEKLTKALGAALMSFYIPIVNKRKNSSFTNSQKDFQLIRRGRYVEFNLLYDRGTLFGLKTSGRTESILMSLPPEVRWEYNFTPAPGTEEAKLLSIVKNPRNWIR